MKKYLCVGKIVKPVGVKGEAKVLTYTDDLKRFKDLKYFFFENAFDKKIVVEKVSLRNDFITLKIENIDTPEQVDMLREKEIYVDRENAVKLSEDSYFIADLVGSKIYDENDKLLGEITDIENYGASDILVFKQNGKTLSVPFLKEIFSKIDVENEKLVATKRFFEVIV